MLMKLKNLCLLALLAIAVISCDVEDSVTTPEKSTNVEADLLEDLASFITKWEIPSDDFELILGIHPELSYDFIIDWGDGTIENLLDLSENPTHTYENSGTYLVAIKGDFPAISMYNTTSDEPEDFPNHESQKALIGIHQWGTGEWETFEYAFFNADLSEYSAVDPPNLSNVTNMESMFLLTNFNGDIGDWDTSNITNMSHMFAYAVTFNQDIGDWNTANVTTMEGMFATYDNYPAQFNQDISGWDVGNVTEFNAMFNGSRFDQNLASWDIGSATDMYDMFGYSHMSVENYSNILMGWAEQNVLPNVPFGASSTHHNCDAVAAKDVLEANGWVFMDLGPDQVCQ